MKRSKCCNYIVKFVTFTSESTSFYQCEKCNLKCELAPGGISEDKLTEYQKSLKTLYGDKV